MAGDLVKHSLWGDKWRNAVEAAFPSFAMAKVQTLELRVAGRSLIAKVVDAKWNSCQVTAMLSRFSEEEENCLMNALRNSQELASSLAHHLQPKDVLELAEKNGMRLLLGPGIKFSVRCSCGERGMCQHAFAMFRALGNKIDRDPFLLFSIRGMDISAIAEQSSMAKWEEELPVSPKQDFIQPFSAQICYKYLDFGHIPVEVPVYKKMGVPDLRNILPNAIVPNALFDASFLRSYLEALQKAFSFTYDEYPDISVDLTRSYFVQYLRTFHCVLRESSTKSASLEMLPLSRALNALSVAGPTELGKASQSFQLLNFARLAALEILQNGAVFPKLFITDKRTVSIFWLPLKSVPQVVGVIQLLQKLMPPKYLREEMGDPKNQIENSAELLLIAIITEFMRKSGGKNFREDVIYALFGEATLAYGSEESKTEAVELQKWFAGYELMNSSYLPSLIVSDSRDGKVCLDLEVVRKATGEEFSLSKIWTRDFSNEERSQILLKFHPLQDYIPHYDNYIQQKAIDSIQLDSNETVRFLRDLVPLFHALGLLLVLPKGLETIIRGEVRPQVSRLSSGNASGFCRLENLLRFDWTIAVGNEILSAEEFIRLSQNADGLLYFKGQYFYVTDEDVARLKSGIREKHKISPIHLLQIALAGEFDGMSVNIAPEAFAEIQKLKSETEAEIVIPAEIHAELRPYQKRGFAWMLGNSKLGFGSIIADDMGLGKTLEVITLLQQMKNDGAFDLRRGIIIVPSGLMLNWRRELEKFAPNLRLRVYHGISRDLSFEKYDLLLTTYGTLRSDADKLKEIDWEVAVIDEAQNIKNATTSQSKAVRALPARIKIAMSGTPVENRLMEFWSIMDFCNKGFFGSPKAFREEFERPIQDKGNKHRAELFKKVTAPFLLRRLKSDKSIIRDLPEKLEQDEWATLTPDQSALYKATLDSVMQSLSNFNMEDPEQLFKRNALVLRLIIALKQICNHPAQYLKDEKYAPELSGKMQLFLDILESILDTDEKVLVFTQFTEMGEILQRVIQDKLNTNVLFYHGGLSIKAREEAVTMFQTDVSKRVLILSLKAGGTGLNLTQASQVVHYDLWWNPAVESQATDRAYRIGQSRNVVVHRLITKDTFEEKINELINSKKKLTEMTVASGENWISKLSDDELRQVFTLGKC